MKRLTAVLLSFTFIALLMGGCSEIVVELDENDFVLDKSIESQVDAHRAYRDVFDKYFTDADYGGSIRRNRTDVFYLVRFGRKNNSIRRFIALANAELEKRGFAPLVIAEQEVTYSMQDLLDMHDRFYERITLLIDNRKDESLYRWTSSIEVDMNKIYVWSTGSGELPADVLQIIDDVFPEDMVEIGAPKWYLEDQQGS